MKDMKEFRNKETGEILIFDRENLDPTSTLGVYLKNEKGNMGVFVKKEFFDEEWEEISKPTSNNN